LTVLKGLAGICLVRSFRGHIEAFEADTRIVGSWGDIFDWFDGFEDLCLVRSFRGHIEACIRCLSLRR